MNKQNLLLHTCCAPCLGYVYKLLQSSYDITVFFYNPNIAPYSEYKKRLAELEKFCSMNGYNLARGNYDARRWTGLVKGMRFSGERSERCRQCYQIRLEESFRFAKDNNFNVVASTLSISPHKDAVMINSAGRNLAVNTGIEFLEADFKKDNGFKKSVDMSKAHGFYRQNYCGCIYSKMERNKDSLWYKKYVKK